MTKLWNKNSWVLDPIVERFETGNDLLLDQHLILCDIYGTLAHGFGLKKIGIITASELAILQKGLGKIMDLYHAGNFVLEHGDEDVHTKIENYLTEKYGDIGKKIHTGRSRNDQVLTAIRLYTKDQLLQIWEKTIDLANSYLLFANRYEFVPMPGYTHMQKAMPSSMGMWASSYIEQLLDDLMILKSVYTLNNQSPLGSAASYGVPLGLDRGYVSELLGFEKVQENSLYCQNSRTHIEAYILSSLLGLLQTVNKFASDVLLFTTTEFQFLTVSKNLCSGSSIMPQKRNLDIAELIRSKLSIILGHYVTMASLSSSLISGYNRDFQDSKKPLFESLAIASETLSVTSVLVDNIKPNIEKLSKALSPELFATHRVLEKTLSGMHFRDAYKATELNGKILREKDVLAILKKSTHIGGTGNLGIKNLELRIKNEKKIWETTSLVHNQTISRLTSLPAGR